MMAPYILNCMPCGEGRSGKSNVTIAVAVPFCMYTIACGQSLEEGEQE